MEVLTMPVSMPLWSFLLLLIGCILGGGIVFIAVNDSGGETAMKDKKERRNSAGMLLGPRGASKFMEWRRARDNAIANPRRLKTCKTESAKRR